jgi:hypothetical protein
VGGFAAIGVFTDEGQKGKLADSTRSLLQLGYFAPARYFVSSLTAISALVFIVDLGKALGFLSHKRIFEEDDHAILELSTTNKICVPRVHDIPLALQLMRNSRVDQID